MKRLHDFHQYLEDGRPHNLDAIQCVDNTNDSDLRRELLQSDPAAIELLTDTFARLADPNNHTPPCQLFGEDELMGTIEPLPGLRLCAGCLTYIEANDSSISVDDRRHYVSHDLLVQVANKLVAALAEPISAEAIDSMPSGTMEALQCLNASISTLRSMMRH